MNCKLQTFDKPLDISRLAFIHYFEFNGRYQTERASHGFCELLYVDSGRITVDAESYRGDLSVGQLLIHKPNEMHSILNPDAVASNVITIGFECFCDALSPFSEKPTTLSAEYSRSIARIMTEAMNVYEPPYDVPNTLFMNKRDSYPFGAEQLVKNNLESFLIQLVRDCMNQNDSDNQSVLRGAQAVYQYLSENYTANISLDNLCFLFCTNKTSLCNDFKREYGMTINEFVNSLRLDEAKALLQAQKLTVTEISEKVGFSSVHYFSRFFKKYTSMTPREYACRYAR